MDVKQPRNRTTIHIGCTPVIIILLLLVFSAKIESCVSHIIKVWRHADTAEVTE